jgi:hypothetical protein
MGLIQCPDCQKMISDKAPACINCGRPMISVQAQDKSSIIQGENLPPEDMIKAIQSTDTTVEPEDTKTLMVGIKADNFHSCYRNNNPSISWSFSFNWCQTNRQYYMDCFLDISVDKVMALLAMESFFAISYIRNCFRDYWSGIDTNRQ